MLSDEILAKIIQDGFFCLRPSIMDDAHYSALDELEDLDMIESVAHAGIEFMNADYIYILKGNPDGIHVCEDYSKMWLEKGKRANV